MRFLFFLIFIFHLFGCNTNKKPQNETILNELNFYFDTLEIVDLPKTYFQETKRLFFQQRLSDFVYFFDIKNHALTVIDLENLSIQKHFTIKRNTTSLEPPSSIIVDETNDNLILSYDFNSIEFYNLNNGTFLRKITINEEDEQTNFAVCFNPEGFYPISKNGKFYFNLFPIVDEVAGSIYKNEAFYNANVELALDTNKNTKIEINQSFPSNYKEKFMGLNNTPERFEIDNNFHAYCFPYNDSVYIFDIDKNKLVSKHFFGSKRDKEIRYLDFKSLDTVHTNTINKLHLTNPYYYFSGISFKNNYYYRTLFINKNQKEGDFQSIFIIYDKDLNYIGESKAEFNVFTLFDSSYGLISLIATDDNKLIFRKLNWK